MLHRGEEKTAGEDTRARGGKRTKKKLLGKAREGDRYHPCKNKGPDGLKRTAAAKLWGESKSRTKAKETWGFHRKNIHPGGSPIEGYQRTKKPILNAEKKQPLKKRSTNRTKGGGGKRKKR